MPYTPPFIPRADAALRSFAQSFAENISAQPAAYGLVAAEATSIMQAYTDFDAAYAVASNPETRTRGTICAKDDARSILWDRIRSYAVHIRANRGIDDGDKLIIGVRPRNISHRRRWCPTTVPLLNYIGSFSGTDELRYHDSDRPGSKAKPRGVERLELWVAYSAVGEPLPKVSQARPIGSFKKSKMLVPQDRQLDVRLEGTGKPTYWARWVGFRGDVGPWSLPCRLSASPVAKSAPEPVAAPHLLNAA